MGGRAGISCVSSVDHDGAEFRGSVVTSIVSGNEVIVHAESEVRGLFVLLRSRTHPEGFPYELLVTNIRDHDRSMDLTASLSTSFYEGSTQTAAAPETGKIESPKKNAPPPETKPTTIRSLQSLPSTVQESIKNLPIEV